MILALETDKHWSVGYVSGVFDQFNVGHLNIIRRSKERCDTLIVGVLADDAAFQVKNKEPKIALHNRLAVVEALKYVDKVDVTSIELLNKVAAWHRYKFDAMFSGDNHLNDSGWTWEEELIKNLGADLVFFPYTKEADL